jgi:hypothetical protein
MNWTGESCTVRYQILGIRPTNVRPADNIVYMLGPKAVVVGMKLTIPASARGKANAKCQVRTLPQDTWLKERVENSTIVDIIYLAVMMTSPTQCTL